MSRWMSVDPGMNLGWAFWTDKTLVEYDQILAKHTTLEKDLVFLFKEFEQVLYYKGPLDKVIIEYPGVWAGSQVSAAANASGDLIKLGAVVGGIAALCVAMKAEVVFVNAGKWQGQLSKDAVKIRVRRALGIEERSSHINDAIGIGLWTQGRFKIANKSRPFS